MQTLETVVAQRLKEFDFLKSEIPKLQKAAAEAEKTLEACDMNQDPPSFFCAQDEYIKAKAEYEKALHADEAKISYLLSTTPFIREYLQTDVAHASKSLRPVPKTALESLVEVTGETCRKDVFHKYLVRVEGNTDVPVEVDKRTNDAYDDELCVCGSKCVFDSRESELVCPGCGMARTHTYVSVRNLSYTEEINMNAVSSYSYKRLNHLSEWLATLQGRQNTDIPEAVIEAVKNEFKKQRTLTRGEIKPAKVRAFLKKLGLSKYYEHTALITNMLNGVPPPQLPAELEAKIRSLFLQIQAPFQKHCPPNRKNFLSYSFCLNKLVTLLGHEEYVVHFPLLKSTEKLWACEKIWKAICGELGWEYISS